MRFKIFFGLAMATGIQAGCGRHANSHQDPEPVATAGQTDPTGQNPGAGEVPEDIIAINVEDLVSAHRMTQPELLQHLGNGIARKAAAFSQTTVKLAQAIESFCADPAANDKSSARAAWKQVMLQWEEFEVLQLGPIAANERLLKKGIYGWPQQAATCRIDEETLLAWDNPDYTLPIQTDRKGLQAIEYLLFEDSLKTSCSARHAVTKRWDTLDMPARARARCAYLKPLALELQNLAGSLQKVWGPENQNHLSGVIGNPKAEKLALQELYANLFYLDLEIKNYKLASPAGHDLMYCPSSPIPCAGQDEFPRSRISREAIQANISAFTDLMFGFEDSDRKRPGGFTALIRDRGEKEVADRSEAITRDLVSALASERGSLSDLIARQNQEDCERSQTSLLCKIRNSIQNISKLVRNEYSRILELTVPSGR